ncbi:MAG: cyclic lactone autoinducer peptide [Desulfitobacteriaceae bacterium]|jgi:cyclic lactone autoinducer peptide|nr:cyclic lactone autoinducer peptide [Desulfitobacteriaceae bacterium]MDD4346559.1 cyclic lactone autoinducer peptide [Desulfitobacteriaceae bacterium]MDD4347031.1 cyclic lactone autoinducer peptide [Desulfitobacteriaceae bacterium]MDD4401106.1 cyclic lactone autoinducer peptide [Desulfitobacteriaceae bacterium]
MKKYIFVSLSTLLLLLASVSSVFACGIWSYQPKTPKALQR